MDQPTLQSRSFLICLRTRSNLATNWTSFTIDDPTRREQQTAHILLPQELFAATQSEWKRYLEFERYVATGLSAIVPSEAYLPVKIVPAMPEMQYVDGRFRHRLPDLVSVGAEDIIVPRRAAVFETEPSFDMGIAGTEILEASWQETASSSGRSAGYRPTRWAGPTSRSTRAPISPIILLPSGDLALCWPRGAQSPVCL